MIHPKVSIAIICYNSENTIRKTLRSIESQNYPKNKVEVLVIDGGSTDKTRKIAKIYKTKIINNPNREFIYGKFLAFKKAKGQYLMYIDSDEELISKSSISKKISCFIEEHDVKAIMSSGYLSPVNYPFINQYLSEYGDPFAYFIYKISKHPNLFIKQLKQKYKFVKDTPKYTSFLFSRKEELPLIEFVALASMIDLTYMKKLYIKETATQIPHFFYKIVSDAKSIAITKNDAVMHYSSSDLKNFLNKISWRVKKNIFDNKASEAGFSGRNNYQNNINRTKKYFFVPYAFSLILPIYDSINLSIQHNYDWRFFIHVPLSIYCAVVICYYYALKILGITPKEYIYGK